MPFLDSRQEMAKETRQGFALHPSLPPLCYSQGGGEFIVFINLAPQGKRRLAALCVAATHKALLCFEICAPLKEYCNSAL